AQTAIAEGLSRLAPGIPVISEEAVADWQGRAAPQEFLLVDPLDGTVEFLAGRDEYTVNIALVRDGTPVIGLIAAPALDILWRGVVGAGAERLTLSPEDRKTRDIKAIRTRAWPAQGPRIAAVSRSHFEQ